MKKKLTQIEIEKRFEALPTLEHYRAIKNAEDSLLKIFHEFAKEHINDEFEFSEKYGEAFHEISEGMRNDPSDCISMYTVLELLCARIAHR